MFKRLWVRIPVPYPGWTWHLFTLICSKNCIVCLERPEIKKDTGVGTFFTISTVPIRRCALRFVLDLQYYNHRACLTLLTLFMSQVDEDTFGADFWRQLVPPEVRGNGERRFGACWAPIKAPLDKLYRNSLSLSDAIGVTRLGNLLHFGQLFKACGNNYFGQTGNIFMKFLYRCQMFSFFKFLGNFYRHLATFC